MSVELDGKELERRVRVYAPTIPNIKTRARFIRAAVALGKKLEIHGLGKLGELSGLYGTAHLRTNHSGSATPRRLLMHLVSSGVAGEVEREACYVHDMHVRIPDKRYVIRLNPDLLG